MSEAKQLSVYWGHDSLYFVESIGTSPNKIFSIPLKEEKKEEKEKTVSLNSDKVQLLSRIQKTFKQQKIMAISLNLSLPTKDIIFRSFFVPKLHPNEIKNVVDFEVRKYLPFDLSTLSYAYHPINIIENNIRKIQIIFVAIKKSLLNSYINTFNQIVLNINLAEPEPISLIRALSHMNLLPENKTVIVLEKSKNITNFIIVDKKIPCFLRDFQIKAHPASVEKEGEESILVNLIKEVRISIEYYKRQNNQAAIDQLLLIADSDAENISKILEKEIKVEISIINIKEILENKSTTSVEFLNAYGSSLYSNVETPANFILSSNKHPTRMQTIFSFKKLVELYKSVLITFFSCAAILTSSIFFSKHSTTTPQKEIIKLSNELGSIKDASTSKLKEKNDTIKTKLDGYKKIHQKSHISFFMALIPQNLPNGTWLNSIDIFYPLDAKQIESDKIKEISETEIFFEIKIDLSGYAYLKDSKEQFKLVSTLIKNFKENKIISAIFKDIDLMTIKSQRTEDLFKTTSFKISFK